MCDLVASSYHVVLCYYSGAVILIQSLYKDWHNWLLALTSSDNRSVHTFNHVETSARLRPCVILPCAFNFTIDFQIIQSTDRYQVFILTRTLIVKIQAFEIKHSR